MITTALVLPMPPALLPPYSVHDPVAALRQACAAALGSLAGSGAERLVVLAPPVSAANRDRGITDALGHRVARHLLADMAGLPPVTELVAELLAGPSAPADLRDDPRRTTLLVLADGSASRGEKAPGHLDARAVPFDDGLGAALRSGDADALVSLDPQLALEVWCESAPAFHVLGEVAQGRAVTATVTYEDAPYGVAWWVARWDLAEG